MDPFAVLREEMVEKQLQPRGIKDPKVLKVMRSLPRDLFVPKAIRGDAYGDHPLSIGESQTISQPYIVALMTQSALLKDTDQVLEVGTGSGYQAAILSFLVKEVYTIERIESLALGAEKVLRELKCDNVHVKCGDGSLGWSEKGPFDAIIVTAGAPVLPSALKEQLNLGGRLVIPVGDSSFQNLLRVTRVSQEEFREEFLEAVRFVPLIGKNGW